MSSENHEEAWDSEDQPENRRRRSSRRDRRQNIEEQVLNVAKDDMQKAREIVMIRKELLRLHYKMKTYHNQARLSNAIIQLVIVALLVVILFRLYTI